MASSEEHLAQAEHNESTASALAGSGFYDWAATCLFYAALHWVQAYLVRRGQVPGSHRQREALMRTRPELRSIVDAYRVLKTDSESARYDCRRFSRDDFERLMGHCRAVRDRIQEFERSP